MKRGEPFKEVLAAPEAGKVSLFKNNNYENSVCLVIGSSQMGQNSYVFDAYVGQNLIQPDRLDPYGLGSILQRGISDLRSAFCTKVKVSGSISFRLGKVEARASSILAA